MCSSLASAAGQSGQHVGYLSLLLQQSHLEASILAGHTSLPPPPNLAAAAAAAAAAPHATSHHLTPPSLLSLGRRRSRAGTGAGEPSTHASHGALSSSGSSSNYGTHERQEQSRPLAATAWMQHSAVAGPPPAFIPGGWAPLQARLLSSVPRPSEEEIVGPDPFGNSSAPASRTPRAPARVAVAAASSPAATAGPESTARQDIRGARDTGGAASTSGMTSGMTVYDSIAVCLGAQQLQAVLDAHPVLTPDVLERALNKLCQLLKQRQDARKEAERYSACLQHLGASFMSLLPSMDVSLCVHLLHTFCVMGHNPGGDRQGLRAIWDHAHVNVLPQLAKERSGSAQNAYLVDLIWALTGNINKYTKNK